MPDNAGMDGDFDPLGFDPAFTCEINPEFPGAGVWHCPEFTYWSSPNEHASDEVFHSKWGTPLVVRVALDSGEEWVGFFESGGLGRSAGVFGVASPRHLLAVNGGDGYWVDVESPQHYALIPMSPIVEVRRAPGTGIVLLVSYSELAAIDRDGLVWTSERLCLDDLRILEVDTTTVRLGGSFMEGEGEFTVDVRTGEPLGGSPFGQHYPLFAGRPAWRRSSERLDRS